MFRMPCSEYYAPGQEDLPPFDDDAVISQTSYSEYYTPGQEDLPAFIGDTAPSQKYCSEYYTPGQEDTPAFTQDDAPSDNSYREYYAPGQEEVPLVLEGPAPCMTPCFDDDGIGLGIMYPDYSEYYDATPTLDIDQSGILPPPPSLVDPDSTPASRPIWLGEYSHLGDSAVVDDSPEREETGVAETPVWSEEYSRLDPRLSSPPTHPIDPRYLDENDSLTSPFHIDEGWEERLISKYATDAVEEENEEEREFNHRASFFRTVYKCANPQPHATDEPYYESEHKNADLTSKANPKSKVNLVDRFGDEPFSLCCIQVKSGTSSTVKQTRHAAECAQVAHNNELTPRVSAGSYARKSPKNVNANVISPKGFSKMFKAGRKCMVQTKQKIKSW
ncbi:hypothetical protein FLONG3_5034 [Fusarium longipes]|uniref:Uncharacterized protein n=1 Tax=Fusarium longipes TaxID=694270 RepID=A0A395SWK5_9HYPO|nr:hypothetical protein FLONG3_5034 [Fusarium longipes]